MHLNSWFANLKNKLCEFGLGDFWLNQDNICVKFHFPAIKQRIIDIIVESNFEEINCSSKCRVCSFYIKTLFNKNYTNQIQEANT